MPNCSDTTFTRRHFIIEYLPKPYEHKVSVEICSTFDYRQIFSKIKLVCLQRRCPWRKFVEGRSAPECGNNRTTLTLYRPRGSCDSINSPGVHPHLSSKHSKHALLVKGCDPRGLKNRDLECSDRSGRVFAFQTPGRHNRLQQSTFKSQHRILRFSANAARRTR